MRDILRELWKKKTLVIMCLFICIVAGVIAGYKKTNFYDRLSKNDKLKVEKYYEKLNKYEQNINDIEESIKLIKEKIIELQNYINNSIYMHLSPDKIYVADVNFTTKSLISEADFLITKDWYDVLRVKNKGDFYNISIMQSTEEQALEIINSIVDNLCSKYVIVNPVITYYIKSDASIVNKQKEVLDNLNGYIKKRTELENSLKNQMAIVAKIKLEEKPIVLSTKELKPASVILRYALFGLIVGVFGLISVFTIRHII